jgi:hypothetical protein
MTGIVDFRTQLLDETGAPIDNANPLPVTGGGGGGGTLSDTVFVDSTGQLFVYRDTGSGTPNAYAIPAWTLYTPSGAVTSASSGNSAASATGSAVPGSAGYTGFNSGGNLVGVSSSNPFPVTVDNFPATQDVNIVGVSETAPLPTSDANSGSLLTRILRMLMAPLGYDKSIQRQRGTVIVESGTISTVTAVTAVTTVTNVTNLLNVDGYNARMQILDQNRTAWALCVRARIT